jgi:pimeloyl-ACP methyl ester carboxylesterase
MAARRPELVEKLILASTTPGHAYYAPPACPRFLGLGVGQTEADVMLFFQAGLDSAWLDLPGRRKLLARMAAHFLSSPRAVEGIHAQRDAIARFCVKSSGSSNLDVGESPSVDLSTIKQAVLVIHGLNDTVFHHSCAHLLAEALGGPIGRIEMRSGNESGKDRVRLELLDAVGHFVHLQAPQDVAQLMNGFLDEDV